MLFYYLGLSIISMSLKDDLTSCLQQEAVILLLGSAQIRAAHQRNFDKKSEFEAIFSVAHAVPHKFVLQFCLNNL